MYKKCHSVLIVIFISLFMLFFSVSCAGTGAPRVSKTEYFEKDISEIAEMITDYNQLKQYFLAIGYGEKETSGDCTFNYRGNVWSINRDAITVFLDNTGNCGGGSNLFCYMLNGDYKEIGYLYRRDEQGGHVINYFCDNNDTWHIVDVAGFVGGKDYANHITGKSLQEVADEYVHKVNHGWKAHNLDLNIRSFYAIKCINGEPHPAVTSKPIQQGMSCGYFAADVKDRVVELYVKDNDKRNSIQFVDYIIPDFVYLTAEDHGGYKNKKSIDELSAFVMHAKEVVASIANEPINEPINKRFNDCITLKMYNGHIIEPNNGFGFGNARKEIKVQFNDEVITDYEFSVTDNIGTVTKTEEGFLMFEASKKGVACITITVGDSYASFYWKY